MRKPMSFLLSLRNGQFFVTNMSTKMWVRIQQARWIKRMMAALLIKMSLLLRSLLGYVMVAVAGKMASILR
jgi:hypothetical protein